MGTLEKPQSYNQSNLSHPRTALSHTLSHALPLPRNGSLSRSPSPVD